MVRYNLNAVKEYNQGAESGQFRFDSSPIRGRLQGARGGTLYMCIRIPLHSTSRSAGVVLVNIQEVLLAHIPTHFLDQNVSAQLATRLL